nr:uncharacterized protein At2g33490-like [Ipomoea trifida]
MKTPLKTLRGFAATRHERKERRIRSLTQADELAQATQDMVDMRDCYDGLLSAAAATANSAYEFSESLQEMGECILEKTSLSDDEETGKVLLMLGKVQFQFHKLLDSYRSHINQTITVPSESLLNELNVVEDMKRQCDEKRESYDQLIKKYTEKGNLRGAKGECFSSHQLQAAYDEYDEGANVFVLRMKSLRQGQSRSLLTQAARHHAAQISFFRKALKYLEEIEPHVKLVTEQQYIDYHFSGLEDDDEDDAINDGDHDSKDDSESHDGELSFDLGQNELEYVSANSMELDNTDVTFPQVAKPDLAKENLERNIGGTPFAFRRETRVSSKSAPLHAELKHDPTERAIPISSSPSYKIHSYVLPTPDNTETSVPVKSNLEAPQTRQPNLRSKANLWHSSPLDKNKYEKPGPAEKLSGPMIFSAQPILRQGDNNPKPSRLSPPLSGRSSPQLDPSAHSSPQLDPSAASDAKKAKRQAFSGPLIGKPGPNNPHFSASGSVAFQGFPQFSGPLLRTPLSQSSSTPKLGSHASPSSISTPKISELHELPRPPAHLPSTRPLRGIVHSGPLVSRGPGPSTNKASVSPVASTLPMPPPVLPRSYSIPSSGQIETAHVSKPSKDFASPPLTPEAISNSVEPPPPAT